jgi:hypothetical protein
MNFSINGKKYEIIIFLIFNTQNVTDIGGCSINNDIECNYIIERDIPIEIKKSNTPDWMQCSLKFDIINNKWIGSLHNKIPTLSKNIFEELLSDKILFNGKIPIFMTNDITYDEWIEIKKDTNDFNDMYFDCPNDTIKKLYNYKNCLYIQISNKGLFVILMFQNLIVNNN